MLTIEEFKALSKDEKKAYLEKCAALQAEQAKIEAEEKNLKTLSMPDFENIIKGTMEKFLKGMTATDKKFFAFPGIGNDPKLLDNNTPEGKFAKTTKFLNALVKKDVNQLHSMHDEVRKKSNLSEAVGTEGGFLVPEEFRNEIMRLAPIYGVIRREASVIPMRKDILTIPAAGTTDQTAHWVGEVAKLHSTDPDFGMVNLIARKLGAIPKVTNELLEDADVDTIQYLAMLISEAFAKEEDNQGFLGIGTPFIGILEATGAPSRGNAAGTISAISYPDLVKATGDLYTNAVAGAKWYMHRTVIASIKSSLSANGDPIYAYNANDFVGFPIVSTEMCRSVTTMGSSSGSVYGAFGNLKGGYAFGDRKSMQMKLSSEATVGSDNLFEQDMQALRMIERVAMGVLIPSYFLKLKTA